MKLETKRTMLIIKKYSYVVCCGIIIFFIGYGLSMAVDWGIEKYDAIKMRKAGCFLTEALNTREAKYGRVEIYNKKLKKVVGCYDQVFAQDYGSSLTETILNSSEGAVMVCNDGHYGYIDPVSGNVLVEPQYIMAWESDPISGLAACVNNELKLGFVNVKTGQVAIPFKFEIDSAYLRHVYREDFRYFDYVFRNGLSLVPGPEGKIGIINEAGEIVVPVEYDDIEIKDFGNPSRLYYDDWYESISPGVLHRDHDNSYDFEHPIILEKRDSIGAPHYGVFDKKGNMNVPVIYDQMAFVDTYDKVLILCQKDGVLRGMDQNGNLLDDFCFYNDCAYADNVSVLKDPEENLSPYILYQALNGYAVMDTDFRVVVMPCDYWDIQYLGNGIFACETGENYSVILKDEKFNQINK